VVAKILCFENEPEIEKNAREKEMNKIETKNN